MRPGQQNKRGRGRNNNNSSSNNNSNNNGGGNHRKGSNPLTRTYDSSGPDVKIRGTAQHIAEKYANLARDAQSSGDRVVAENYLQHAEHYNRIILSAQAQMQERYQRDDRSDYADQDGEADVVENEGGEAVVAAAPVQQRQRPSQPPAAPVAVAAPEAVIDGSGPQPEIEGTPIEVAMESEASAVRPQRRRAPARPRRPRRGENGDAAEGEGAQPAEDAPASELATASE